MKTWSREQDDTTLELLDAKCLQMPQCRCLMCTDERVIASSSPLVLLSVWCLFDQGTRSLNYQILLFSRTLLEPILVIPTSRNQPQQLVFGKLVARPMPNWVFSPKFPLEAAWHKFGGWWSSMAVIAISLKGLFSHLTNLLMVQGISCGYLKTPKYNLMLQCFKIGIIPAFPAISSTWAQWFRRWRNGPSAKSTSLKRRASLCSSFVSRTRARCSDDSNDLADEDLMQQLQVILVFNDF